MTHHAHRKFANLFDCGSAHDLDSVTGLHPIRGCLQGSRGSGGRCARVVVASDLRAHAFTSAESHAAGVRTFTTDTGYAALAIKRHHRDSGVIVVS
jgi:hypothetical protein